MPETRARAEARYWEERISVVQAENERLTKHLAIAVEALEDIIQQAKWGNDAAESETMIAERALTQMSAED